MTDFVTSGILTSRGGGGGGRGGRGKGNRPTSSPGSSRCSKWRFRRRHFEGREDPGDEV